MRDREIGPVYEGSDGRYYTVDQVEARLDAGAWRPCLRDRSDGRRLVGTDDGLCMLIPVDPASLPAWVQLRADPGGVRAVDTRRARPRSPSRPVPPERDRADR